MLASSELKFMSRIPQISPISVFCKIPRSSFTVPFLLALLVFILLLILVKMSDPGKEFEKFKKMLKECWKSLLRMKVERLKKLKCFISEKIRC